MSDEFTDNQLHRISTAVETIEGCLERLVTVRESVTRDEYRNTPDTQDIVERRFVTMTEAALDIGTVLIIHEQGKSPSSNPSTMRTLGDLNIIRETLAKEMVDAARFRNVLAHTYGDAIDHNVVYDALEDLERYREFVIAIRDYLESVGALE